MRTPNENWVFYCIIPLTREGTGKTITAIQIANKYYELKKRQFLLIVVPTIALMNQWIEELCKFGIKQHITISGENRRWRYQLKNSLWNYKLGVDDRIVVIGTYSSIGSGDFNNIISENLLETFLLADECHNIGLEKFKYSKIIKFNYRLGLSATPEKWKDDFGNEIIKKYFPETILDYSIDKAIEEDMLVEYNYYPILVELDEEELASFERITKAIACAMQCIPIDQQKLENLMIKRGMILKKANKKKEKLIQLLNDEKNLEPGIIFCAPSQEEEIVKILYSLGIKSHRYTSKIGHQSRQNAIKMFKDGKIEMLVSIKCLDEGVDIPFVKNAYILSSTSNPREYIQRRGRILRKHKEKKFANIYDFVIINNNCSDATFESIARIEMPRFAEFSDSARNKYQSRKFVKNYLSERNLEYLLDEKPTQIY